MPKTKRKPMVNITINIPDSYDSAIMALQTFKLTPSRSEFIRSALRDFLREELINFRDLDNVYKILPYHPIILENEYLMKHHPEVLVRGAKLG